MKPILIAITLVVLASTNAAADFWPSKAKRGYWWGELPPPPTAAETTEQQHEPPRIDIAIYSAEQLWNMHPDQFAPLMENAHKQLVQHPTEQNAVQYYTLVDIARRKAVAVTNVTGYVMQAHSTLNISDQFPANVPGKSTVMQTRARKMSEFIVDNRHSYGLIVFETDTCQFCATQRPITDRFANEYGWETKHVNIHEQPELAALFGVETVPTLMLVNPHGDQHIMISKGITSLDVITENTYRGIKHLQGAPPDAWYDIPPVSDTERTASILQNYLNTKGAK